MSLSAAIKAEARRLGFARVGIVPAGPSRTHPFYQAWLERGFAGEMGYLARHAAPKRDASRWVEGARSIICLAASYAPPGDDPAPDATDARPRGRVSRYAWGRDYHEVLAGRLDALAEFIRARTGTPVQARSIVDSAPLLEREWAARAGLGWVGRNAMLIDWELGSYLLLAELIVNVELDYDAAPAGPAPAPPADESRAHDGMPRIDLGLRESCGTCRACIDACPTAAIVADKTVDARHCISYLTIELKGPIPAALREPMGDWIFGCDICQEVCPWNRRVSERAPLVLDELRGAPEDAAPELIGLLGLDDDAFRARFRHRPQWRARRRGLLRNAAVALGNALGRGLASRTEADAVAALSRALGDPEPVIRGAAAWALGRARSGEAGEALSRALAVEADETVRAELAAALARGAHQAATVNRAGTGTRS